MLGNPKSQQNVNDFLNKFIVVLKVVVSFKSTDLSKQVYIKVNKKFAFSRLVFLEKCFLALVCLNLGRCLFVNVICHTMFTVLQCTMDAEDFWTSLTWMPMAGVTFFIILMNSKALLLSLFTKKTIQF